MIKSIIKNFNLGNEIELSETVIESISQSVEFKRTNLWILVFAIFIASLGLNMNSTAVIIGAMLISPLMGPIIGMGLGLGINDLQLVRKAIKHFTFAVIVSLITSFVYFSISPIQDAYSELLARTFPTIYDVLIALFGGLAGMLATSSKIKGNVIPGVAIATALMPPLCTAGFGLATFNLNYFFGAFYLFTINTVFIALATFLTVKFLGYPQKHLEDASADKKSHRIITAIAIATIIPSIYFGYVMIDQNNFLRNSGLFIEAYSNIEGNFLLNKEVDPNKKSITLIYGGKEISNSQINNLKSKLAVFNLQNTNLVIKQGISFLPSDKTSDKIMNLNRLLEQREKEINLLTGKIDSLSSYKRLSNSLTGELKTIYPGIYSIAIIPYAKDSDGLFDYITLVVSSKRPFINKNDKSKIENLLKERIQSKKVFTVFLKADNANTK